MLLGLQPVPRRILGLGRERVEVLKDRLGLRHRCPLVEHERRDAALSCDAFELVAPLTIRRHLPQRDVDPELRQSLAPAPRVRSPLCLVQIHHPSPRLLDNREHSRFVS